MELQDATQRSGGSLNKYNDGCRHLDADEAVVRGAAWYAANLSTTFRLNKKFGMSDGATYPIIFKVHHPLLFLLDLAAAVAVCPRVRHLFDLLSGKSLFKQSIWFLSRGPKTHL